MKALTARETEVVRRMAAGETFKEIAAELGKSQFTVQSHIRAAYQKLGARNAAHAAALFTARPTAGQP